MKYTELEVRKEARLLVKIIYGITKTFPELEKFGLTSQIQRASISVPSNIAEGCGREGKKIPFDFSILPEALFMSWKLNYIWLLI